MLSIFKKNKTSNVTESASSAGSNLTAVFVDLEYWVFGYRKNYSSISPDVAAFKSALEKKYPIKFFAIFGNLSSDPVAPLMPAVRSITDDITGTVVDMNPRSREMTDYIIADRIYRCAFEHPEIQNYIMVTGSCHFNPLINYLTKTLGKKVIIYAVKFSVSDKLLSNVSEINYLPENDNVFPPIYAMIFKNFRYVEHFNKDFVTFSSTVSAVAKYNQVSEQSVNRVLEDLIGEGYIIVTPKAGLNDKIINTLSADWEALKHSKYANIIATLDAQQNRD